MEGTGWLGVVLVETLGVGAEGKSEGGRSGFAVGGASIACDSARGGATLFRVFGVMRTFGAGEPAGALDNDSASEGKYTTPSDFPAAIVSSSVGTRGGNIFGRKITKMIAAM